MMKDKRRRRRRGRSVQELIGIKSFTDYGLLTNKGEIVFFSVAPTNISVLSKENIGMKIQKLTELLSAIPDAEIICMDASECFDTNMLYLQDCIRKETNPKIKQLLLRDIAFLDEIQVEMATARQFMLAVHIKNQKKKQVFELTNDLLSSLAEYNFEAHRLSKEEIKRFLALYFEASVYGDQMPDVDGAQYLMERE